MDYGTFPWHVLIQRHKYDSAFCGGSIISSEWVLSAAHCCLGYDSLYLKFGTTVLNYEYDYSMTATDFHIHPYYHHQKHTKNVCLIKLPKSLQFSGRIQKISLEHRPWHFASQTSFALVSGFGQTSINPNIHSNYLLYAYVQILRKEYCDDFILHDEMHESNICSIGYVYHKPTCIGDIGSALVTKNEYGKFVQIGITSFGKEDCKHGTPSFYLEVSSVLQYIYYTTGIKSTFNDPKS